MSLGISVVWTEEINYYYPGRAICVGVHDIVSRASPLRFQCQCDSTGETDPEGVVGRPVSDIAISVIRNDPGVHFVWLWYPTTTTTRFLSFAATGRKGLRMEWIDAINAPPPPPS